jgi:hypothetical protein
MERQADGRSLTVLSAIRRSAVAIGHSRQIATRCWRRRRRWRSPSPGKDHLLGVDGHGIVRQVDEGLGMGSSACCARWRRPRRSA